MERIWLGLGAVAGLLAVAMAAVVSHALPDPAARETAASAVQMQGWHALALVGVALWGARGGMLARLAGAAFLIGILGFCGALYALAFAGLRSGPLAPVGGVVLMLGWALLGLSALPRRQ